MSPLLHVIPDRAPALATLAQECKGCPGTLCKGCHGTEHALGCPAGRSPAAVECRNEQTKKPGELCSPDSQGGCVYVTARPPSPPHSPRPNTAPQSRDA